MYSKTICMYVNQYSRVDSVEITPIVFEKGNIMVRIIYSRNTRACVISSLVGM